LLAQAMADYAIAIDYNPDTRTATMGGAKRFIVKRQEIDKRREKSKTKTLVRLARETLATPNNKVVVFTG